MKKIIYLLIFTLFLVSCGEKKEVTESVTINSNTGVVEEQAGIESTKSIKTSSLPIESDQNIEDALNNEVDSMLNELDMK